MHLLSLVSRRICTTVSAFCFPLLQSQDAWLLVLKMGAIYILVSILFKSYFLDIPALFVVVMMIMTLLMFLVVLIVIVIAVLVLAMDVAKSRHHDLSLC
jgi:hypothetical protein